MKKSLFNFESFFNKACFFEASLIIVAIILGWIAGIDPFINLNFSTKIIAYGFIGTVPLFLMFLLMEQIQGQSVMQIRKFLLNTLGPNLHHYHWTNLLLLGSIAGISEEILFRGVLQPWIEASWGVTAGLFGSNIIFGLVHSVTPLYAVLAGLVGVYLGLAMDFGGDRALVTPIIIHSLYDFLAFIALMRLYRTSLSTQAKN